MFGRSPFINVVDVDKLISKYDTVGFNNFAEHYPINYSWTFDQYIAPKHESTITFGDRFKENPEGTILIRIVPSFGPILYKSYDTEGHLKLARTNFTPCMALNWSILEGYTHVYLVGIDHKPTDKFFVHHDGIDSQYGRNMPPDLHANFRTFVYNCSRYVQIIQTNPYVKDDWYLPFKDIDTL